MHMTVSPTIRAVKTIPLLPLLSVLAVTGCADGFAAAREVEPEALASSIEIIRDSFGVPHIYGPTDAAVMFGVAWAQAEDNWWQVEDNFVRSVGRASELYGEETWIDDVLRAGWRSSGARLRNTIARRPG